MSSQESRSAESVVKEIRRKFSSGEKIRIVLEGLRGPPAPREDQMPHDEPA